MNTFGGIIALVCLIWLAILFPFLWIVYILIFAVNLS